MASRKKNVTQKTEKNYKDAIAMAHKEIYRARTPEERAARSKEYHVLVSHYGHR